MLFDFKHLAKFGGQLIAKREFESSFHKKQLLSSVSCELCFQKQKQSYHTSSPQLVRERILEARRGALDAEKKRNVVDTSFSGDERDMRKKGFFPSADLPNTLFDGVPFKEIPIVSLRTTKNNTIISLADKGITKLMRSSGMDGFKNTRKGTNVAAQTTGTAFGFRALKLGYKNIRIVVDGLGPGRLSALKGLQLSGMNVISLTDNTTYIKSQRPRKQRRL